MNLWKNPVQWYIDDCFWLSLIYRRNSYWTNQRKTTKKSLQAVLPTMTMEKVCSSDGIKRVLNKFATYRSLMKQTIRTKEIEKILFFAYVANTLIFCGFERTDDSINLNRYPSLKAIYLSIVAWQWWNEQIYHQPAMEINWRESSVSSMHNAHTDRINHLLTLPHTSSQPVSQSANLPSKVEQILRVAYHTLFVWTHIRCANAHS